VDLSREPALVEAFLAFTGDAFCPDQHHLVRAAIALAGHSLAIPGDWASLDARRFTDQLSGSPTDCIEAALYLMGFLGWMGITGRLTRSTCLVLMTQVRDHVPHSPLLSDLLRMAAGHLHQAAA
jgi:hypothetical protein